MEHLRLQSRAFKTKDINRLKKKKYQLIVWIFKKKKTDCLFFSFQDGRLVFQTKQATNSSVGTYCKFILYLFVA